MPSRTPLASVRPDRPAFYWLATVVLLIAILARGQEVLIPLVLAMVIAFALSPLVKMVERKLGRGLAVALVVLVTLASVSAFGFLLKSQLVDLSAQMTKYSDSIRKKMQDLRGDSGSGLSGLSKAVDKVALEMDEKVAENRDARPVKLVPAGSTAFERLEATVLPVFEPLAKALIVLVLVIFLLIQREDLRDRFIRLAGRRNVTLTTRTLDEAGERISRFLLLQSAINAGFGIVIALGLWGFGIPYPALWGFVAAILRFVPFVGSLLAMVMPTMLAFALFEGWWQTGATLGLFVALDVIAAYAVEPVVIGKKTGVSSMAMLVSAIVWTWLWGAAGLVLSTPLTVCLVVLGKHVPRLQFLSVLLSDEPALDPDLVFYQRLLAGDEDEAGEILEKALRTLSREQMLDAVIIPALVMAEHDRGTDVIAEADHVYFMHATLTLVEHQTAAQVTATAAAEKDRLADTAALPRRRILGVPARNEADELVWEMLRQLFDTTRFDVQSLSADTLVSEVIAAAEESTPDLICVTSVPPGGLVHVRHLCKRLAARLPELRILVIRPGVTGIAQQDAAQKLIEEGATDVAFTLAEARTRVDQLSLLAGVPQEAPAVGSGANRRA